MNTDKILGVGLLFFCVLCWFWLVPVYIEGEPSTRVFSHCVLILIALPSLGLCLRKGEYKEETALPRERTSKWMAIGKLLVLASVYFIYLLMITRIGFFVSSYPAAVFFLFFLGIKGAKKIFLPPLAILIFVYLLIEKCLNFDLPNGMLF